MWEFTVAFGWGIILFYVLFELRARIDDEGWSSARTVGAFVLPVALGMFAVALAFFPSEVKPLIPALQSSRILGAHVTTMVLVLCGALGVVRRGSRLPDPGRRSGQTLRPAARPASGWRRSRTGRCWWGSRC